MNKRSDLGKLQELGRPARALNPLYCVAYLGQTRTVGSLHMLRPDWQTRPKKAARCEKNSLSIYQEFNSYKSRLILISKLNNAYCLITLKFNHALSSAKWYLFFYLRTSTCTSSTWYSVRLHWRLINCRGDQSILLLRNVKSHHKRQLDKLHRFNRSRVGLFYDCNEILRSNYSLIIRQW